MNFHPFEVTIPHVIYACLGGFIVLFGMFSLLLRERLYIGEACWAFLFGVIIGPYCANIFDPRSWGSGDSDTVNTITLEFTRVVLATGVFAIGVELPKAYMARHWKSLFFLLFPVMTWGWFVSAGLIYAFIPGLSFLSSLAVAACLTPTDPILAAAVVGGKWADKHVPAHIRHLLAAESGCNDGAAYPFLFIALYLILDKNTGHAIRDWFLLLWIYQVIVGIVIGGLLGFAFRHLMKFCQRRDLIDRHSYVAQYVSLAMLTIGVCSLLGSDDLLAAFSCGTAFAWDGFFNRQTEESVFSSVLDLLFNVAAFVFVGAWMPFDKFQDAALTLSVWRLIVIAILVLLLKRLPVLVALYKFIPDVKTFREALFTGHFGPVGIGAVFISTLAAEILHTGHDNEAVPQSEQTELLRQTIQPIVAFMVLCSITIHGLSIPGFSLGRRVHSVSRTWSIRRDTAEAPPEWTTHITRVTRPEEIVINRDHVDLMEKGHLEGAGTGELTEEQRKTRDSSRTEIHLADMEGQSKTGKEPEHQDTDEGSTDTKVNRPIGEHLDRQRGDYREESPPDGDDTYLEWVEPHHRIIERRQGLGSDVEVIVTNEDETAGNATGSLRRHNSHDRVRKDVEKAKLKLTPPKRRDVTPRPSRLSESSGNDDDEEGWASEISDSGQPIAGPSSVGRTGTPTSVKGEKKRPRGLGFGKKGRQRVSLRRTLTTGQVPGHHTDRSEDGSEEEHRGRSGGSTVNRSHSRSLTPYAIPTLKLRNGDSAINQRLESLRVASRAPTREASPSRSVRFVDEAGDGGALSSRASRVLIDPPSSSRSPDMPSTPTEIEKVETKTSSSSSPSVDGGRR
ncbi:putative Na(+)/H(+) antiporter C3A11.09 [Leucoagaricus sp. SymC.cos]|nr:putative Na(+)/H(+) antiporter C3A11.09 [Leucoagaricus sp. SymC.cos]